jgi:hypothetical protein
MKRAAIVVALVLLALPATAKTYKSTYSVSCDQVWAAVKDTLSNAENYEVTANDDAQMSASYNVRHAAHVNVTGAVLQRTNKVSLIRQGATCEMHVVSNFSGWEHHDQGDFKKRVDEVLAKQANAKPAEAAKPEEAPKQE